MSSAYENAMSDLQANNATQKYPVGTNDIGMSLDDYSKMIASAEAAEARAAQLDKSLHIQLDENDRLRGCLIRDKASSMKLEARAAELIEANREQAEAIATLRAERDKLMQANRVYGDLSIEAARKIEELRNERDELARQLEQVQRTLKAIDRIHSEAFNESDGVYRP